MYDRPFCRLHHSFYLLSWSREVHGRSYDLHDSQLGWTPRDVYFSLCARFIFVHGSSD
jgi:hypothetical protein